MSPRQQQRSPSPPRSNTAQPSSPTVQRAPYSKRHASFNSPREVPLPSPSGLHPENVFPFSSVKPFDLDSQPSPTVSPQHTPLPFGQFRTHEIPPLSQLPRQQMNMKLTQDDSSIASRRHKRNHSRQHSFGPSSAIASQLADSLHLDRSVPSSTLAAAESTTIFPARPSSLAETYSLSYSSTQRSILDMPTSLDRYSSSSLPIPSQIPFYALPKANPPPNHTSPSTQPPPSELSQPSPVEMHSGSSFPIPSHRPGLRCPSVNSEPTSSSSSSSSSSSRSEASVVTTNSSLLSESPTEKPSPAPLSPRGVPNESQRQLSSASESQPVPRPISPFRAPRPPPPQPRTPALEGTAMRRYMTPSQLQSASPLSALSNPSLASASGTADLSSSSVMALLASDQYPPPEPPTILPPDPTHDVTEASEVHNRAPYMPFLSHVLPPPDSWIQVESTHSEYKLLVRLPGFSREGITLASKRRRILHIVADSWENGGGHFERRISFGYDADLAQVRAEFDGVMLRIAIPRRVSPITWNANASTRMGRI